MAMINLSTPSISSNVRFSAGKNGNGLLETPQPKPPENKPIVNPLPAKPSGRKLRKLALLATIPLAFVVMCVATWKHTRPNPKGSILSTTQKSGKQTPPTSEQPFTPEALALLLKSEGFKTFQRDIKPFLSTLPSEAEELKRAQNLFKDAYIHFNATADEKFKEKPLLLIVTDSLSNTNPKKLLFFLKKETNPASGKIMIVLPPTEKETIKENQKHYTLLPLPIHPTVGKFFPKVED